MLKDLPSICMASNADCVAHSALCNIAAAQS